MSAMPSDRTPQSESSREAILRENEALKKRLEWFSRQLYGRVMPGRASTCLMQFGRGAGQRAR